MAVQGEDVIDIVQGVYPGHDIGSHFDQSSDHRKKRYDGLDARNMLTAADTVITEGCLGAFERTLEVGHTQPFTFTEDAHGPWYLSETERAAKKYDQLTEEFISEPKTAPELRTLLGHTNRGARLDELQREAEKGGRDPASPPKEEGRKGVVWRGKGSVASVLGERADGSEAGQVQLYCTYLLWRKKTERK